MVKKHYRRPPPVSGATPFDIVGLGQNAVDWLALVPHYPPFNTKVEIKEFLLKGGGPTASAVCACARLGLRGKYIGKVGNDDNGAFSLKDISSYGVDISETKIIEGAVSQFAVIVVDERSGERTILWQRDQPLHFKPGDVTAEQVTAGRMLHTEGNDAAAFTQAARWAHERDVPVSIDIDKVTPGVDELLHHIDYILCSSNVPTDLTRIADREKALFEMDRRYPGLVGCSVGDEGCLVVLDAKLVRFPGYRINAVDTTGAGDAFHGGFCYALLQDWKLEDCFDFANAVAAINCTARGARGGLPYLDQVFTLMGRIVQAPSAPVLDIHRKRRQR
ncbi:MAG: carbohydrate kinase family protein [Acidobacteriota bacterium]